MLYSNILHIKTRKELRNWLQENSAQEKECWIAVKRGKPVDDGTLYYLDAVEEALCFGWIDSTVRKIGNTAMQRFSPRRKKSPWTELNKERARRLEKIGLMTDAGRAVLPQMDIQEFKIDDEIVNTLQQSETWDTFNKFPPLYQRIRAYNITFAKKRAPEAYKKALAHLIEETRKGRMYGEWNDYGRLLDY